MLCWINRLGCRSFRQQRHRSPSFVLYEYYVGIPREPYFYAPQLYRQVLLNARISYGNSVCLSACLSRPGGIPSPDEIETLGLHHMIARSL